VRERQLNVRLNDQEAQRLEAIEQRVGLNGANLVRMWIKREFDTLPRMPARSRRSQ